MQKIIPFADDDALRSRITTSSYSTVPLSTASLSTVPLSATQSSAGPLSASSAVFPLSSASAMQIPVSNVTESMLRSHVTAQPFQGQTASVAISSADATSSSSQCPVSNTSARGNVC